MLFLALLEDVIILIAEVAIENYLRNFATMIAILDA